MTTWADFLDAAWRLFDRAAFATGYAILAVAGGVWVWQGIN